MTTSRCSVLTVTEENQPSDCTKDYLSDHIEWFIMWKIRSKSKKSAESTERERLAVEIARLSQGTPVVGYHDEEGRLVIPEEYDD